MANIDDIKIKTPDQSMINLANPFRPGGKRKIPLPVSPKNIKEENQIVIDNNVHIETTQFEHAQIKTTQFEQSISEASRIEPSHYEHIQTEPPKSKTAQDEQSHFEQSQNEHIQNEPTDHRKPPVYKSKTWGKNVRERLSANPKFLKISDDTREPYISIHINRSHEELKKLEGDEFKLLFFLTLRGFRRDPESGKYGDGTVRAALPYLVEGTGIPRSTVSRAFDSLKNKGYVKLIKADQRGGYIYQITRVLFQIPWMREKSQNETVQNGTAKFEPTSSPNLNTPAGSNWGVKEYSNKSNKPLSLNQLLKPTQLAELESRWLSFMKKEREREEKSLLKLMQQKPEEAQTLFTAFQLVLKEQDEYGQIKSAIAVLETNYSGQYKGKALAAMARQEQKLQEQQTSQQDQAKQEEEKDTEAQAHLIRMRCFEETFPDVEARKHYIQRTCKGNPMFSMFGINSPIAVSYAVSQWAQGEGSEAVLKALDQGTSEIVQVGGSP